MIRRVKEQVKARRLRAQGKSINEIVEKIDVAKSSVSIWVRDIRLSTDQKKRLAIREIVGGTKGRRTLGKYWRKYHDTHPKPDPAGPRWSGRPVETFFNTWTPNMAYVLGYFAADGCMYKNKRGSCYMGFCSVERELIELTRSLLNVHNAIEEYVPKNSILGWQKRYTLQVGSKKIYQQLLTLGFTPNKSLTLRFPHTIPDEMLRHFTRGYLDGDGNVHYRSDQRANRTSPVKTLSVRFTSGSYQFLSDLKKRIGAVTKIRSGSLFRAADGSCVLGYSTDASRQLYDFLYPTRSVPCLKRKRDAFIYGMQKLT